MSIELNRETLLPVHTALEFPETGFVRVAKIDKAQPDENTYARLKDFDFHNGTIEVDVRGGLLPDAPDYARGFIGIVFRVSENDSEFECFYIRPTNGRNCDDPVRKAHGCQYFSYPGYTFAYFREFGIAGYEGRVDTIALNEWSHIRAVIADDTGVFWVDGVEVLRVTGFKHGPNARGGVGLYVDIGTDGYFRNLRVQADD